MMHNIKEYLLENTHVKIHKLIEIIFDKSLVEKLDLEQSRCDKSDYDVYTVYLFPRESIYFPMKVYIEDKRGSKNPYHVALILPYKNKYISICNTGESLPITDKDISASEDYLYRFLRVPLVEKDVYLLSNHQFQKKIIEYDIVYNFPKDVIHFQDILERHHNTYFWQKTYDKVVKKYEPWIDS